MEQTAFETVTTEWECEPITCTYGTRGSRRVEERGGDFVVRAFHGRGLVLAVGDASTKGASGRLHASLLKRALYATMAREAKPGQMLNAVARSFMDAIDVSAPSEVFATLFVGCVDLRDQTLTFASSGTEGALVLHPLGDFEELEATGPLIGLEARPYFEQRTIDFRYGHRIFAYTDGVTEARSMRTGQPFGTSRLASSAKRCSQDDTRLTLRTVLAELDAYTGGLYHDDATLVTVA